MECLVVLSLQVCETIDSDLEGTIPASALKTDAPIQYAFGHFEYTIKSTEDRLRRHLGPARTHASGVMLSVNSVYI